MHTASHLKGQVSISPTGEDPGAFEQKRVGSLSEDDGNHEPGLAPCITGFVGVRWGEHHEAGPSFSQPNFSSYLSPGF